MRNLDAINPRFAKPERFIPMAAVLPFLMGGMGWLLAGPATAGLPFSHAPLSICCASTMLAGMMLFFLPRLFRWDWNIGYFGLASLQLASVSLPGVIPWLCIVVYGKAGFWLRAGRRAQIFRSALACRFRNAAHTGVMPAFFRHRDPGLSDLLS